jgi:hypothetical protein
MRFLIFMCMGLLTVHNNGDDLGQDVAIGTLEGRDLAELVQTAVVIGDTGRRLDLNELDVEVVGLSDDEERVGTWVALCKNHCEFQGSLFPFPRNACNGWQWGSIVGRPTL